MALATISSASVPKGGGRKNSAQRRAEDDPALEFLLSKPDGLQWTTADGTHHSILGPDRERDVRKLEIRAVSEIEDGDSWDDGFWRAEARGKLLAAADVTAARQEFKRKAGGLLRRGQSIEAIAEQAITELDDDAGRLGPHLRKGWDRPPVTGRYQVDPKAQKLRAERKLKNRPRWQSLEGLSGRRQFIGHAVYTTRAEKVAWAIGIIQHITVEIPSAVTTCKLSACRPPHFPHPRPGWAGLRRWDSLRKVIDGLDQTRMGSVNRSVNRSGT